LRRRASAKADWASASSLSRYAGVALDHRILHLNSAAHCIDYAAEFGDSAPDRRIEFRIGIHLGDVVEESPVRFTTRPLFTVMVGSIRSLRSARSRANIRSSSAPARRLYPTTSDTKIAASFRVSTTALLAPFGY
jgi:hypothetical protein